MDTLYEESDGDSNDLANLRTKFVAEVDLPECEFPFSCFRLCSFFAGEEPLLKESERRFVLFPIQYHEVGYFSFSAS